MRKRYNAIIIGCGAAGLSCAAHLRMKGLTVAVLSKTGDLSQSNSFCAQGGIIAYNPKDDPKLLAKDIENAGCRYNNREAVVFFSENGPKIVFDFLIDKAGVEFSRNESGEIDFTEEAAHSIRRIAHYRDLTGESIEQTLFQYVKTTGVDFYEDFTAVDLISNNHHSTDPQEIYKRREIFGVYALDNRSGEVRTLFGDAVVLATGGVGNLYQYTTNPASGIYTVSSDDAFSPRRAPFFDLRVAARRRSPSERSQRIRVHERLFPAAGFSSEGYRFPRDFR